MDKPPQAGKIAHDSPVQNLAPYEYHPSNKTLALWTHDSFPINFTLVVDYFGVNIWEKSVPYISNQQWKTSTKSPHTGKENYALQYNHSGTMKKARYRYPCQDMYIQTPINFNTKNQNDHKIRHTPRPNLSMKRTTSA